MFWSYQNSLAEEYKIPLVFIRRDFIHFHRDICRIDYNQLALPKLVLFRYGHYIEYLYDAAGNKLQTKHYQSRTNI